MKKTLFTILTLFLCVLFLITACDSPQGGVTQETTTAETPAGSDISPDETTAENEVPPSETTDSDSSTIITTTEPYETVDPDLLYEIRSGAFADEAWLKRALPNIIDISVEYRISEKEFEPVYCDSSEDRKTLEELIKIVGKPHGFTNRTGYPWLVWITQEGTFVRAGIDQMTSNVPKDISLEERIFRYSLIYVQRLPAAPETTAEPYETVDPDLLYEIRNSPFADEAWLKQEFPNIIDAEITYRAPEQKFESLFSASNDDYKTLDELIKIVGKPHGYTNRTGVVLFVWITAEGNPIPGYVYTMTSDLPEDVSFEERHLHYSKIYIQKPQSAPESRDPSVTTTTPETTTTVP